MYCIVLYFIIYNVDAVWKTYSAVTVHTITGCGEDTVTVLLANSLF